MDAKNILACGKLGRRTDCIEVGSRCSQRRHPRECVDANAETLTKCPWLYFDRMKQRGGATRLKKISVCGAQNPFSLEKIKRCAYLRTSEVI
eukprot:6208937-Pleurochrysis_carterae.AAC.2